MFWALPLVGGAALGAIKGSQDQAATRRQNLAAAAQTRYSPLTGMGPGQIQTAPSIWGNVLQGAMAGGMLGSAGQKAGWWDLANSNKLSQVGSSMYAPYTA